MNKEKIKIGILGCGRVCEHYIQKIFIPERVGNLYEVVAVCDIDIKRSNYVANIFSCNAYNSIQEFVQQKNMEVATRHEAAVRLRLRSDTNLPGAEIEGTTAIIEDLDLGERRRGATNNGRNDAEANFGKEINLKRFDVNICICSYSI